MIELGGGCRVIGPEDGKVAREGNRRWRQTIGQFIQARDIAQVESLVNAGVTDGRINPTSEEVHFVLEGAGTCYIDGYAYAVEPGSAAYVPPGAACCWQNPGPGPLRIVSVCCPEARDGSRGLAPLTEPADPARPAPPRVIHERDRRAQQTGIRTFTVLADNDVGCQRVTQFLGVIPPSEAPPHYHTYEEAIYILEGSGRMWADGQEAPVYPGSCIYLPRGVSHSMKNDGTRPIRLLGVFHPSGSPAASYTRTD